MSLKPVEKQVSISTPPAMNIQRLQGLDKGLLSRIFSYLPPRDWQAVKTTCKTLSSADLLPVNALKALQGPRWAHEGVIYSIFVRNFSARGDFNGVTEKLGYLKALGVSVLWLLPIHPIGEKQRKGALGSPYSIQDYYTIDPAYGTVQDLRRLVARAHGLGLKVILDAVLNHTSWDSNLIKQHPEWFRHDKNGVIIPPMPDWSDVAALNYDVPQVHDYIINMLKYWIKECDVDGYRFDAASFVPLTFWKKMKQELIAFKPDSFLLGELESPESLVDCFHTDYAWKFYDALEHVIVNGEDATPTLKKMLGQEQAEYPMDAVRVHFSDNHDKRRAISVFGEKGALAASALIFALPGIPLLYNGMEIGDVSETHAAALFEKLPIFWSSNEVRPEFQEFYQQVIALRNKNEALRDGELTWVRNSAEDRVVTFLRKGKQEEFLVAINLSNRPFDGVIGANLQGCQDVTPGKPSVPKKAPFALKAWEFRYLKSFSSNGLEKLSQQNVEVRSKL